ncbi:MAG: AI-2E family transporter, partial [Armatimonadia bacterium]|nr:AI-2E family transporter [Armatimonadia bacterium]
MATPGGPEPDRDRRAPGHLPDACFTAVPARHRYHPCVLGRGRARRKGGLALSAEPETQDRRSPIDLVDLVRRYWHYIALVAVTAWLIYQVRSILGPFIIGILAGYILDPALDRLERKGWSRSRAVAFVFMLGFLLLAVAVLVLVPLLITQIQSLADTVGDTAEKIEAWVHTMPGVEETVEAAQDSPEDEAAPEERGEPDAPPAEEAAPGEEAAAAAGTEEG